MVLFILWQTNLSGPKLNRYALIFEGINIVFICISRGIVELIIGKNGFSTIIITLLFLLCGVGISLLITYLVQKKNGMLDSYQAYSDIMTEEEFERWMRKKNKK